MPDSKDIITDFDVWPTDGEAPLPVALFTRLDSSGERVVKRVWTLENGKKVKEENYAEAITHEYKNPGTFNDKLDIKLMRRGGDPAGHRDFTITVTTPKERPDPFIDTVGQAEGKAYAKLNELVWFEVIITSMAIIKDVIWKFGDDTGDESSNRTPKISHPYKKSGRFTGKVTVKTVDNRQDTKQFYIFILPK